MAAAALLLAVLLLAMAVLCGTARLILYLAAAFLCIGLMAGSMRLHSLSESLLEGQAGKWITAEVQVTKAPHVADDMVSFTGRAMEAARRGQELAVDEDVMVRIGCGDDCGALSEAFLMEGSRVRLSGTVREIDTNPGADFDYGRYLRRRGINVAIVTDIARVELLPRGSSGFSGSVDTLRQHARMSLAAGGWNPEKSGSVGWGDASGLFQGMVIGETSHISDEVINDFRASGLLHLLAVSGQNVVLLGFVVAAFCRGLHIPRRTATVAAAVVIIFYVPLTGADASIMRAGAVGLLGLAADLFSRQTDRYYFLALAAAIILTLNPNSLFDPGFQLSFAAVLSIFLVAPVFTAPLGFMPGMLREPVAISAAAGLVTAPITLFHFHQVPLVTVPANVAAAPVAGPVMLLGVITIAAAPLSGTINWVANAAACFCTGYLIVVSRFFASLPGAVYVGESPGIAGVSAFYAMITAMVVLARKRGLMGKLRFFLGRRPLVILALLLLVLVLYTFFSSGTGTPPSTFTASFLDVGQGDATLLQDPDGATVLIDGGPGQDILALLRESGVERLDAVILTHPHADHLAGLDDVLSRYDVGVFYDSGQLGEGDTYTQLLRLLDDKGIEHQRLQRGQMLEFGALELSVYHPGDWLRPDDTNANSVVLVASYGELDILLPGDAEGDVLMTLDLPQVEVYKAPHHGSRDPYIGTVLNGVEPGCAVVSAGEGNEYGHPSEDTLSRLREAGAAIYRTDFQGTVRISSNGCDGVVTER